MASTAAASKALPCWREEDTRRCEAWIRSGGKDAWMASMAAASNALPSWRGLGGRARLAAPRLQALPSSQHCMPASRKAQPSTPHLHGGPGVEARRHGSPAVSLARAAAALAVHLCSLLCPLHALCLPGRQRAVAVPPAVRAVGAGRAEGPVQAEEQAACRLGVVGRRSTLHCARCACCSRPRALLCPLLPLPFLFLHCLDRRKVAV